MSLPSFSCVRLHLTAPIPALSRANSIRESLGLSIAGSTSTTLGIQSCYLMRLSYSRSPPPPQPAATSTVFTQFIANSLRPNATTAASDLLLETSFFGVCYPLDSSNFRMCTTSSSAHVLRASIGERSDPLGLIRHALQVQRHSIFPWLTYVVPSLHDRVQSLGYKC